MKLPTDTQSFMRFELSFNVIICQPNGCDVTAVCSAIKITTIKQLTIKRITITAIITITMIIIIITITAIIITITITITITTFVLNCCQTANRHSDPMKRSIVITISISRELEKKKTTLNAQRWHSRNSFMIISLHSCIFSVVSVDVDEVVDKFMFAANLVELFNFTAVTS